MHDGHFIKIPRYCTEEQAQRWAAIGLMLDHYGETPRFACPACKSTDGMKVSVPIELGHCVDCGTNRSDVWLLSALERAQGRESKRAGVERLA